MDRISLWIPGVDPCLRDQLIRKSIAKRDCDCPVLTLIGGLITYWRSKLVDCRTLEGSRLLFGWSMGTSSCSFQTTSYPKCFWHIFYFQAQRLDHRIRISFENQRNLDSPDKISSLSFQDKHHQPDARSILWHLQQDRTLLEQICWYLCYFA